MSEELKPCPFCNAEITMGNICSIENYNTSEDDSFHVMCNSCLCETQHFDSEQEAIEAWNKRVIPKGYIKLDDALKIIEDQKFKEEEDEVQYVANVQLERVKKKIKKQEGEV